MADTTCHMSISLDGFVAGPDQSRENPLGKRGRELHGWHLGDERANEADATAARRLLRPRGAYVMGRNMFGPIRGEWDEEWTGWWGPEPPYHAPVFVLTHHPHAPIGMEGGTTFHFVTDGFDAAYAQAQEDAGDRRHRHRGRRLRPSAKRCWQASSTSSGSTSPPFCSGPASGSSTVSPVSISSPPRFSIPLWRPTSVTAERDEMGARQWTNPPAALEALIGGAPCDVAGDRKGARDGARRAFWTALLLS